MKKFDLAPSKLPRENYMTTLTLSSPENQSRPSARNAEASAIRPAAQYVPHLGRKTEGMVRTTPKRSGIFSYTLFSYLELESSVEM